MARRDDTALLVRRARQGDRAAWAVLYRRYRERWLARFHKRLGRRLRKLQDTEDLVESALRRAFEDLGKLRNEAAFFAWVSAIIEHRLQSAARRRDAVSSGELDMDRRPQLRELPVEAVLEEEEERARLLDAILELFEPYPESMALVFLRFWGGNDVATLTRVFERSERSIYRFLETGIDLLRSKLEAS